MLKILSTFTSYLLRISVKWKLIFLMTFTGWRLNNFLLIKSILAAINIIALFINNLFLFFLLTQQRTTTRLSIITTILHRLNMSLAAKIAIAVAIWRKIVVATIKTVKKIHRAITKQTAQVPSDQRVASFHRIARKIGIILQGWTT